MTDRRYTTADGLSSIRLGALPDPDLGSLALGVRWCVRTAGPAIDSVPTQTASLSANWPFLRALEHFGVTPSVSKVKLKRTRTTARARASYYLEFNGAEVALKALKVGGVIDRLEAAARTWR